MSSLDAIYTMSQHEANSKPTTADIIKEALDSISDEIAEIRNKIAETEGVEHDD